MKNVAVYIRVSTLEQAIEGYSVGEQKERLISYCKARDWLITEIYVDGGYTGDNLDRPGIQKLISETNNFDIVLVYKLDRLSRRQRDTLYLIEDVFLPKNIDFVSMNESFDTGTPFGRAVIGILSVFAQLEREQIKERTKMGKLARAKEGLFHGGIYYPIGYDYIDGRLVVNEYEALQIRKIYELYLDGMSPDKISEYLRDNGYTNKYGSWSELSHGVGVLRVLTSEVYLGRIKYDDVVVENAHEPIITQDIFNKVKAVRKKRQEIYGDSAYVSKYLLTGMLFCGRCGARYAVKHNYKNYKYYVCYTRGGTAKNMKKADTCDNSNWKLDDLESYVENEIKRLLFSPKYYNTLVQEHKKELKLAEKNRPLSENDVIKNKIASLDKQIDKLMELYQNDKIPVDLIASKIDKLYREKTLLLSKISNEDTGAVPLDFDTDVLKYMLEDFATIWEFSDGEQKRKIIQSLVNRIILDGDNIKIEWSFL